MSDAKMPIGQAPPAYSGAPAYEMQPQYPAQAHQDDNTAYQQQRPIQPDPQVSQENKMHGSVNATTASHNYPQTGNVMPIAALTSAPAPIQCPNCHQRAMTKIESHAGNTTHAWAVCLCVFTLCCCIPYCIDSTKDVEQRCSNCNTLVATWHRSGRTVVHFQ